MGDINWNEIAEKAGAQTDKEFSKELASLTSLKTDEIETFITNSKITNADALETLKVINDATLANTSKAKAIANIKNGVGFLVQMASKVI